MKILVDNMNCQHCVMNIENALKNVGFKRIKIDLKSKTVSIKMDDHNIEEAKKAIEDSGYHFQLAE